MCMFSQVGLTFAKFQPSAKWQQTCPFLKRRGRCVLRLLFRRWDKSLWETSQERCPSFVVSSTGGTLVQVRKPKAQISSFGPFLRDLVSCDDDLAKGKVVQAGQGLRSPAGHPHRRNHLQGQTFEATKASSCCSCVGYYSVTMTKRPEGVLNVWIVNRLDP